jgi:hypothetical protein
MQTIAREQLYDEIRMIPENRLSELYQVLHYFRLGLGLGLEKRKTIPKKNILTFAGAWKDMPEDCCQYLMQDIEQRRSNAFFPC